MTSHSVKVSSKISDFVVANLVEFIQMNFAINFNDSKRMTVHDRTAIVETEQDRETHRMGMPTIVIDYLLSNVE